MAPGLTRGCATAAAADTATGGAPLSLWSVVFASVVGREWSAVFASVSGGSGGVRVCGGGGRESAGRLTVESGAAQDAEGTDVLRLA